MLLQLLTLTGGFQSTPSVWRETSEISERVKLTLISIHSLRVEGDATRAQEPTAGKHFNPLPPCGGRLAILPRGYQ